MSICVFLVLFLSGLGLLGFVRLMVEQTTKDIGIRKVLGASEWRVAARYVRKFAIMGTIGGLAAWPVAYYVLTRWLQGFAYRIEIGVDVFVYATLLTTSIAILIAGRTGLRDFPDESRKRPSGRIMGIRTLPPVFCVYCRVSRGSGSINS